MKALVVSRLGLGEKVLTELRNAGVKEFVDYFKQKNVWETSKDILDVAKAQNCDTVVVITNFKLAVEILANGVKPVFVVIPRFYSATEIVNADIYEIYGDITVLVRKA